MCSGNIKGRSVEEDGATSGLPTVARIGLGGMHSGVHEFDTERRFAVVNTATLHRVTLQ